VTRVLVICPDKTGPLMAGTAIRSVEIARALAQEYTVTLAIPDGSTRVAGAVAQVHVPGESMLPPLIAVADVVLVAGRSELMSAIRKPLIVDLYDPFILSDLEFYGERFNTSGGRPLLALRWLQHHLENGDLFLCASVVQRSFWLGMLAAAGRVNRANYASDHGFDELLAVVPFGIPSAAPERTRPAVKGVIPGIATDDKVVLWAGGLWNWVDPLTLLRALHRLRARRPEIKALFLGVRHPNPDIGAMEMAERAVALAHELDLYERSAFFIDWVPYDERQNYLLESDVGVSLHHPGVEAQFAFRTRVLDYFWCGLPMVLSRGDELAALVEREALGLTVPEGDVGAVAEAITQLLDAAPDDRRARFAAVRSELSWSRIIEPVRRFCRTPSLAADKSGGAWFAPGMPAQAVLRKEDALVSEETLTSERQLSASLGDHYAAAHGFVAAYDNLCRIDVLLWAASPSPSVDLLFTLREEAADGRRLARVAVALAALRHNDWQRFEFRPIPNSRGRRYHIVIEVPGVPDSGVSVWLCTPAGGGAPVPALSMHYLVKGVLDAVPVDSEAFLFLHNTTVGDALVPGVGALVAEADAFGASLLASDAGGAQGPQAPAPGTVDASGGGARAPAALPAAATSDRATLGDDRHAADTLRAELARVAVGLAVTRRELASLKAAHAAATVEKPVLLKLLRELAGVLDRALRTGAWFVGCVLVVLLSLASVPLAAALGLALAATDAWVALQRRRGAPGVSGVEPHAAPQVAHPPRATSPVSVVIPTWNGRELLAMSLPPLRTALASHPPGGEIIVVDNGSDDDTCAYLAAEFPDVRVLALPRNEGFAGAANRGIRESLYATVILLNNDMVVEPDFIAPLLEALDHEPDAFGISCQIDFIDKSKPRWETGKVHAQWKWGTITLFHLDRYDGDLLYPIFFAGGGASAYDREKFLALGGFDEAVFSPVYIEDADLGYRAWKRGWPSLFQPRSLVHHKHRSTTRRLWAESTIHGFFVKNLAALVWKNVDDWQLLAQHLAGLALLPLRALRRMGVRAALATWCGLVRQAPPALRARAREGLVARRLDDATIFLASRYRYAYRARFGQRRARAPGARLRLLMVSPYSPYPALHGGAVRMLALLERLAAAADVTLVSYADTPAELDPRSAAALRTICHEVVVLERPGHSVGGALDPAKTRGFWSQSMSDTIEYFLDHEDYDVVQIEYTHMAHFLPPPARHLLRVLVEHDVSFVSIARSRASAHGLVAHLGVWFEWMRMLRYEIAAVERADLVLTMSDADRAVLGRFVDTRGVVTVPNGVDCVRFPFAPDGRDQGSILFVGFFRHEPNVEAAQYFCRAVLPLVRRDLADVRFRVVGAYPPEVVRQLARDPGVEVTGRVEDIGAYYRASAVFVAPVLQGSGTRLKILEAMASGCPVVSTTIGAEGLGATDGLELLIGDTPEAMARAIVGLLRDPAASTALAARSRRFVEAHFDWDAIAARLLAAYRDALAEEQ
jgi:glycosyltransferase involved in cell wall biosynthesis/GT2 family glycosyltransferase